MNRLRVKVWRRRLSCAERRLAVVDADGLMAPTTGECKEGMDMAYKGVWGYHPLLVSLANTTEPRERPENVKEGIVRDREYENIRLVGEHVAEFPYQPTACNRAYRVVVLRKNLSVERGERVLFDDVRYFFYITNLTDRKLEFT